MFERLKEKLHDLYHIIPYDYRIGNIWYRFSCRIWYKYTTIKSRELGHCYCDTVELLPYTIMEIFCRFVEEELKEPCYIEWNYHKINWNGKEESVDIVWKECYKWWNETYAKNIDHLYDEWYDFIRKHKADDEYGCCGGLRMFSQKFDTEENKIIADELFKKASDKDKKLKEQLESYLIMLVQTRDLMWT